MLTKTVPSLAAAALAAAALGGLGQGQARAAGTTGGGGFGATQCGQSYTPSCTVTAGTPGDSTPGGSRAGHGGKPPPGAGRCPGTVSRTFGCVPPGCVITVQTLACPAGRPGGGRVPAPRVLARLAVRYLRLPDPVIGSSPPPGAVQLTRLPVWLWIAAAAWRPQSRTARVPGESVTATATPVSAAWSTGDGTTLTCHGPGTPYRGANPAAASPGCGHTYDRSSAGQPGGAYRVTVTITWDITWHGSGGTGGTLAPLHTAGAARFRVAEAQALDTSSGGGR